MYSRVFSAVIAVQINYLLYILINILIYDLL